MNIFQWLNENVFKFGKIAKFQAIFLGWKSEETRTGRKDKKGAGSVGYYADELADGHEDPRFPRGLISIEEKREGSMGSNDPNTPPNTPLSIVYLPDKITEDQIRKYLDEIGLIVK